MIEPDWTQAEVDPNKLLNYLLSHAHPRGKSKARFFGSLGYTIENWFELKRELIRHVIEGKIERLETTQYGVLHKVDGFIYSTSDQPVGLRSIWLVKPRECIPHFITAYPLKVR